ncbi:ABC transporter ATP-binding protein [Paraburkholderia caballeronis]|uniref:Nucleoside ABC transporter ATP-binding protein n=1 Tax=Paraburkholderia caballeronis TaxID=416943 RepID=A0A1H7LAG9_9BURK|nr:ABC transporter ATP-binding protein [Paraburkholderia caballeronis]PXW28372.1 nucleoside ABC transporter ATP-binding protein [Paraburkholderia caballeronis]PXX03738.1 nucleoside ABC transporter ATP-binding protein [Paraburkholderia caballeronis]RAK04482.1 nucleoside ABC transporter ATP-binding protein [Paraburkholderia caballeronis]SED78396.1 nucleoside ABC transporter ATP-binding protein [Paraburkholderia caballeronis]SEK95864.1 nucleoside ABC transporter ATP-binding protein [Paraburkholde
MNAPAAAAPRAAPILSLAGIGKRFGSFVALDGVSLDLLPGDVHCLLGENGAGKSTLCNVIFGVHQPDAGAMQVDGAPYRPRNPRDALDHGIAMVHQHFSLVDDATVLDNLLLGQARGWLDRAAHARRVRTVLERVGLELALDARVADLSVGERQRVEIVKCLMREPRLLLLDEPTAVLLPAEIDALLDTCARVAARDCAVVLVTHKLKEIARIASQATVLQSGRVVARSASPSAEIDRLVHAMIHRATADDDSGGDAGGTASRLSLVETERPSPNSRPLADEVLQIDGLGARDADGVTRLEHCTLVVNRGEIVGIAGVEGNGQTELGAVLAGMLPAAAGRFFVAGREMTHATPRDLTRAGVGIVPEDRHAVGCVTGMTVAENLLLNQLDRYTRGGFLNRRAMRADALDLMARFDVRASGPDALFGGLSGGNQQKAVLARELTLDPLVFLLAAQPTRGLDVGAVAAVYSQIRAARDRGAGVLLISSELDELMSVADRIVVLYRGRIMGSCAPDAANRGRIGAWMAGSGDPA